MPDPIRRNLDLGIQPGRHPYAVHASSLSPQPDTRHIAIGELDTGIL
jgi:hypothetical protein